MTRRVVNPAVVPRGGPTGSASSWSRTDGPAGSGRSPAWPLVAGLSALMAVMLLVLAPARPAAADPPGPTDYQTTVEAVDPDNPGIEITILGGDSFVELAAEPGVEVEVIGYEGEPYLHFWPDGTVMVNERSPSRWLNEDRYSDTEVPAEASATAEPAWQEVADGGVYAWHDHRAHWMVATHPPSAEPGDTVLEGVVPMVVDGTPVAVHVRSVLLPPPSPGPPSSVWSPPWPRWAE
ncbi:MAG: hypothetical protein ACK5PP_06455 [Acidimicrobiales bacterium]